MKSSASELTCSVLPGPEFQGRGSFRSCLLQERFEGLSAQKRLPEHKVSAEKALVCLLLCMIRLLPCSPIPTSPCCFFDCGKGPSPSPQSSPCLPSFSPGGLQPSLLQADAFALTGCPGARVSLGKTEMAARQVSCWFPCSSFLLLAEDNLNFFFFFL